MKKTLIIVFSVITLAFSNAQVTITPNCFSDTDEITIVYDATQGTSGLVGATKVYMHAGVVTDSETGTSWQHVIGNWGSDDGIGEMTKVAGETDKWEITLTSRTYFDVPTNETIYRLAMVFRNADGSKEGKNDSNGDIYINLANDPINLQITSTIPVLVDVDELIPITATTCSDVTFNLYVNDVLETTQSGTNLFDYSYQVTQNAGETVNVKLTAELGETTNEKLFSYTVRSTTITEARPAGIIDGINYDNGDATKVTLSLWAPYKSSVYVVGDFSNWNPVQMKRDGEHFWVEVTGLTPGQEYAYQYLVDETLWIADPYADKILDPDDKWIPDTTYPGLMEYPAGATHANWYENRAAILQTDQTPYTWINTSFQKPEKEKLVIYELLVRDFLGESNMNYQALIDTLGYLENLGVNAIELMPIMEFNGNDSWGYNPTFMFAVDKAYGTKNDLKEFIDEAHGRGMAVILDMVMNQNDIPSPYAQMYFDFSSFKPTGLNPWFNTDAKHPYNVFFDINHESNYTKTWLDSINHYWLNEFHFDGYRFDLSKGFTQRDSGGDVGYWGQKDDSRIAILKRMADEIWSHSPDAYVILEHFADNTEEKVLADYGMMLWGNSVHDYNEANMGYASNKSIGWAYYESRGWTQNNVVAYMESHDEERQMYKIPKYGNIGSNYNIQKEATALQRLKLTAAFFFTVPGPKMLWQFGEFGYDVSIDENGRTGRKPTKWEYLDDTKRSNVYDVYSELIGLRNRYDVFTEGDFSWQPAGDYKSIHISSADTNVVIIGNFDVEPTEMDPAFQNTGTWYDFFSGEELSVNNVNDPISLNPGVFHIYTDKKLHTPKKDIITAIENSNIAQHIGLYPNPVSQLINLELPYDLKQQQIHWRIIDIYGKELLYGALDDAGYPQIDVSTLPGGFYSIMLKTKSNSNTIKFIKE
ncbi:MAG: DUF4961 domain-containing protein [Bacteroidota bacterium]